MAEVAQITLQDGRYAQISTGTGAGHISNTTQFDPAVNPDAYAIIWAGILALYPDPMGFACSLGPCYQCPALIQGKCDWAGSEIARKGAIDE